MEIEKETSVVRRTIWMTPDQRKNLWVLLESTLRDDTNMPDTPLLVSVLNELSIVQVRQRLTGRLVQEHLTGLMLPNDALPVKVTDEEAIALLKLKLNDRKLARMLKPGPIKQGRR